MANGNKLHATINATYCIVWRNPGSTNDKRVMSFIQDVEQAGVFKKVIVKVAHKQEEANRRVLLEVLEKYGKDSWLVVSGGDGTVGAVANLLMHIPQELRLPILPLPAGNSNDISRMLHGQRPITLGRLNYVKRHQVHTLECRLRHKDKDFEKTIYSVAYISFGVTARTAQIINQPSHRDQKSARYKNAGRRRFHEIRRFSEVLNNATPFEIQEDGKSIKLFERLLVNGRRMAKYFRLPAQLDKPEFQDVSIDKFGPWLNIKHLGQMTSGKIPAKKKGLADKVEFVAKEQIIGQHDGETFDILPGTEVKISLSAQPLDFISLSTPSRSRK